MTNVQVSDPGKLTVVALGMLIGAGLLIAGKGVETVNYSLIASAISAVLSNGRLVARGGDVTSMLGTKPPVDPPTSPPSA